ncbi:PASTA domain-containing protein [Deinococcus aerolatus]|uniref:PASTA domain-containing protein n=1 Tax=Deinococcus aerolatus TaxID=522487 RepID=UPI001E6332B2|nr:PASTA domain-containing protein [Deinococcus aerolatus]
MPDLTGLEQAEAEQRLRERRLTPRVRWMTADGAPGTVRRQTPDAGEVAAAGTQVTLYIIKARELSDLEKIRKVLNDAKILTAENFGQVLRDDRDVQQFVSAVRDTHAELLRKIDGLATKQDVQGALQNLATRTDVQSATGALEQEEPARKRFEELKRLIQANSSGGDAPTPGTKGKSS